MIFGSVIFALAVCLAQVDGQEECPLISFCECMADLNATQIAYENVLDAYFKRRLPIRDQFAATIRSKVDEMNAGSCDDPFYRQTALEYVYYVLQLCGGNALRDKFWPLWKNEKEKWTNAQKCVFFTSHFPIMCAWVNINDAIIETCNRLEVFENYVYEQWRMCQNGCRPE